MSPLAGEPRSRATGICELYRAAAGRSGVRRDPTAERYTASGGHRSGIGGTGYFKFGRQGDSDCVLRGGTDVRESDCETKSGPIRGALVRGSAAWGRFLAWLALIGAPSAAPAQQLPAGGTTSWEIQGPEEIVTFVLFDAKAPGVSLPAGLRFVFARDAQMPAIQEHLKQHPDHAEWAFSFVEITRQKAFLIDGKGPTLPENGGIGLWFAPVDPCQLAEEIPKAGLTPLSPRRSRRCSDWGSGSRTASMSLTCALVDITPSTEW